jgi:hypothetical protein
VTELPETLMFAWLTRQKQQTPPTGREPIWNDGLEMAMEWGENLLKPIQPRLASRYPALTPAELDEINTLCQAAMKFGHETVYGLASRSGSRTKLESFATVMKRRYPWVDAKNVSRLFNQGMYFAWKDMGFE